MALVPRIQKNQQYSIPDSLTHSSGTITAAFNGVNYSVVLSGLSANSLYYLYLRINGGSLALFFSASAPSVYRVSFPEAILVGAFYASGTVSPSFGSFVNIEGSPRSAVVSHTPSGSSWANTTYQGSWERDGDLALVSVTINITGAIAAGDLTFTNAQLFNGNLTVDSAKLPKSAGYISVGVAAYEDSGTANRGGITVEWGVAANFLRFRGSAFSDLNGASNTPIVWANGDSITFSISVPIVGWSNTPLKDL